MITASGLVKDKKIAGEFVIENISDNEYCYENDSIFYDIEYNCVQLYIVFQKIIFPDIESFYLEKGLMPIWSYTAGHDSDLPLSKDLFAEFVKENNSEKYHKHLYLADCQSLIGAMQDRFIFIKRSFIEFYKALAEIKGVTREKDTVMWTTGSNTTTIFSHLYHIFIMFYSTFDLLTKITYELQFIEHNFDKYPKLKSSNILFGEKKRLEIDNCLDSIFESHEIINIIINLRNELIHNGSWETHPKVFIKYENFNITEKWIFFPDMISGNIQTFKNRKRFFSTERKINLELPQIVYGLMNRLNNTIKIIKNKYSKQEV